MLIRQPHWAVDSAGWSIDQSAECITLCPADVDAALQFSCHRKRMGDVTTEEMHSYATNNVSPFGATPEPVLIGPFSGFTAEFEDSDRFWRRWWLASGRTHLFITFNCAPGNRSDHSRVVDWILSTLRVLGA